MKLSRIVCALVAALAAAAALITGSKSNISKRCSDVKDADATLTKRKAAKPSAAQRR